MTIMEGLGMSGNMNSWWTALAVSGEILCSFRSDYFKMCNFFHNSSLTPSLTKLSEGFFIDLFNFFFFFLHTVVLRYVQYKLFSSLTRKNIRCCKPFPDNLLRLPSLMNSCRKTDIKQACQVSLFNILSKVCKYLVSVLDRIVIKAVFTHTSNTYNSNLIYKVVSSYSELPFHFLTLIASNTSLFHQLWVNRLLKSNSWLK